MLKEEESEAILNRRMTPRSVRTVHSPQFLSHSAQSSPRYIFIFSMSLLIFHLPVALDLSDLRPADPFNISYDLDDIYLFIEEFLDITVEIDQSHVDADLVSNTIRKATHTDIGAQYPPLDISNRGDFCRLLL